MLSSHMVKLCHVSKCLSSNSIYAYFVGLIAFISTISLCDNVGNENARVEHDICMCYVPIYKPS